jgi:hypothetical protein
MPNLTLSSQDEIMTTGWKLTVPQVPGLYAVFEPWSGANKQSNVYTVAPTPDGDGLMYGGMRRVEDAPPGTTWFLLEDHTIPNGAFQILVETKGGELFKVRSSHAASIHVHFDIMESLIQDSGIEKLKQEYSEGFLIVIAFTDDVIDGFMVFQDGIRVLLKDCDLEILAWGDHETRNSLTPTEESLSQGMYTLYPTTEESQ